MSDAPPQSPPSDGLEAGDIRAALDHADAGIVITRGGVIRHANPAFAALLQRALADLMGASVRSALRTPDAQHLRVLGGDRPARRKIVRLARRDGSWAHVQVTEVVRPSCAGEPPRVVLTFCEARPGRGAPRAPSEVAASERARIGETLHDGVAQTLTGVSMMASALLSELRDHGLAEADQAQGIVRYLGQAKRELHTALGGLLLPEPGTEGLPAALRHFARQIEGTGRVRCRVEADSSLAAELTPEVARNLYRIAREAVHNAQRHGGDGTCIDVVLRRRAGGGLTLRVRDDGVGARRPAHESTGLGLQFMRRRAQEIGASLDAQGLPACGFEVRCIVPAPASGATLGAEIVQRRPQARGAPTIDLSKRRSVAGPDRRTA